MENSIIFYFLILCTSGFLTYCIRFFTVKHQILDIPNERSSHSVPTPRGGGLAIVITWFIGITILYILHFLDKQLYFALLSGILLAIVSVIDDLSDLKPVIRLGIQTLTALLAFIFLNGINPVEFSGYELSSKILLYPIAIVGIVWFINLYNFLDGIDGYASLEAIFISLFLYVFTGNNICLILIVSTIGFLFWNWPKAKIFMGDIGSTQLGYILIVLGIYFHNQGQLSIIHWLMLSSLFWFDATITLFRRWKNKEKLTLAHRKHVYQRAVQSGLSHQKTIVFSLLINIFIVGLIFASRYSSFLLLPMFFLNMLLLYGITKFIDRKVPFKGL